MRVEAIKVGFYANARRRTGDVFTLAQPAEFSSRWMREVADDEPERHTGAQAALDRDGPAHPLGAVRTVNQPVDDSPDVETDFDPFTR